MSGDPDPAVETWRRAAAAWFARQDNPAPRRETPTAQPAQGSDGPTARQTRSDFFSYDRKGQF